MPVLVAPAPCCRERSSEADNLRQPRKEASDALQAYTAARSDYQSETGYEAVNRLRQLLPSYMTSVLWHPKRFDNQGEYIVREIERAHAAAARWKLFLLPEQRLALDQLHQDQVLHWPRYQAIKSSLVRDGLTICEPGTRNVLLVEPWDGYWMIGPMLVTFPYDKRYLAQDVALKRLGGLNEDRWSTEVIRCWANRHVAAAAQQRGAWSPPATASAVASAPTPVRAASAVSAPAQMTLPAQQPSSTHRAMTTNVCRSSRRESTDGTLHWNPLHLLLKCKVWGRLRRHDMEASLTVPLLDSVAAF